MRNQKLLKVAAILLIIFLTGLILKFGKPFLLPLTLAALLAMLMVPVCEWLEKKGVGRIVSTLLSVLMLVAFIAALMTFIGWQAADLGKDASKIEQRAKEKYQEVQQLVSDKLGVSKEKQEELIEKQKKSSGGGMGSMAMGLVSGIGGFLANFLLVLVYIFLLIYFRDHLQRFVLRVVPDEQEENAAKILRKSRAVTQKYLTGLAMMIFALWVMYGIGFSIAGVENAIFFAILCGVLEIVPFVGNLIGTAITILMAFAQGGGTDVVIGILITYGIVQFVQSYILEPLVVGSEVNINPLFTIVGLIAGEFVWGIAGMVLAIPIMGVTKIICDHIEPLKPYGQLLGEKKKEDKGFKKKMKDVGMKVVKKLKG